MFSAHLTPIIFKLGMTCIGIIGIASLIIFHEFGHFLFCKLFRIKTPTFSIGFGTQLFAKKIGETTFTLSAIPMGGYVEIATQPDETAQQNESQHNTTHDVYFNQKPFYQQLCVMLGGIAFNLLFAYITFSLLFYTGLPNSPFLSPKNSTPVIEKVLENSPAEKAGLQEGDRITAVNNVAIHNDVLLALQLLKNTSVENNILSVERSDKTLDITIANELYETPASTLSKNKKARGNLGILFQTKTIPPSDSLYEAIAQGIATTNHYISATINGYLSLFSSGAVNQLSGPLMIISSMGQQATKGAKTFFIFLAIISINLAVLNLIPLPILDGGQILFFGMEALVKNRQKIQFLTWILLLVFLVCISIKEIYFFIADYINTDYLNAILKKVGL